MALTSVAGGLVGLPAIVGYGESLPLATVLGITIDLTGLGDLTFMVPRDGVITALSAFYSVTTGLAIVGSTVNITAQLYSASPADNVLTAVPGSEVILTPGLSGIINIGDTASATAALNISVTAGTRLALVFSIDVSGIGIATTIIGTISAGVAIS